MEGHCLAISNYRSNTGNSNNSWPVCRGIVAVKEGCHPAWAAYAIIPHSVAVSKKARSGLSPWSGHRSNGKNTGWGHWSPTVRLTPTNTAYNLAFRQLGFSRPSPSRIIRIIMSFTTMPPPPNVHYRLNTVVQVVSRVCHPELGITNVWQWSSGITPFMKAAFE